MTTSREQRSLPVDGGGDGLARLEREIEQLRQAVESHATVDQAIGVLIAVHRLEPATGFDVLREVSQHTNIKMHTVAGLVIGWALGEALPASVARALDVAVQQHPPATRAGSG